MVILSTPSTPALQQSSMIRSLVAWRAQALTDIRMLINRNSLADQYAAASAGGGQSNNIVRCTGIIGLSRSVLVMDKLESPAHRAAIQQSGNLRNVLNDMLEASRTKDNGERTFKAKLLTSVSPIELHLDDVLTSIQALSIHTGGDTELLDMLYSRAATMLDDSSTRLTDNREKLSSRCLDVVCAISSMVPNISKEGRKVALNAARIVFEDPNSDLDTLWSLRKASARLGFSDVINNIDKAFYSRIGYMARIDNSIDEGVVLMSGNEAMLRISSSIPAAVEWASQSREGLDGLPMAIKGIIQDGVRSTLKANEVARIINTCLLCASRDGGSIDTVISLLRPAVEKMMSIKAKLGRDDIYCIMLALLKTRHSSMEYRNTVLDAFLDKSIDMLNIFKPYQLAVVIRVLLQKVVVHDENGGRRDDEAIMKAIIDILVTRGREFDIDSITDIIKDTYTYDGKDRLSAVQRKAMTDVLKTIFSISDGYERAAEIELIEASLDALGDNKKANTALHLLCILADHGLASSSSRMSQKSGMDATAEEIPLASILRQYIKHNPPVHLKSTDIARNSSIKGIFTEDSFDVLEVLDDFVSKANNILLMTTEQCTTIITKYVQLLAASIVMESKRQSLYTKSNNSATTKLATILFDQYSLYGTRNDLRPDDIITIIEASLQNSNEVSRKWTFQDPILAEAIRVLVPVIHDADSKVLIQFITTLSHNKDVLPNLSQLNRYSPIAQLSSSILSTLSTTSPTLSVRDMTQALKAMARLDWYSTRCITAITDAIINARLTSTSMDHIGDLAQSLRVMRVHDSPLLRKLVTWYKWMLKASYGPPPYPPEVRAHLASFAMPIADLGYTSTHFIDIIEAALIEQQHDDDDDGHTANPKLLISFLYILSRQGQEVFSRPSYIAGVRRLVSTPEEELQGLSAADWIKAFQVHLGPAIEGLPYIKKELVYDAGVKKFIEDNASFSWYSAQERSRTQFLHSDMYQALRHTIEEDLQWPFYTANQLGEVYHTEFISDRNMEGGSNDRRTAIVCIPPMDELRYYRASMGGNIASEQQQGDGLGAYKSTRVMIGSSLLKVRHLMTLGWKVVPIWISEWSSLQSTKDRVDYLIQQSIRAYALGPAPDITYNDNEYANPP